MRSRRASAAGPPRRDSTLFVSFAEQRGVGRVDGSATAARDEAAAAMFRPSEPAAPGGTAGQRRREKRRW